MRTRACTVGRTPAHPNPALPQTIVLPKCESTREKSLQSDDVSLGAHTHATLSPTQTPTNMPLTNTPLVCAAYEFAKKVC